MSRLKSNPAAKAKAKPATRSAPAGGRGVYIQSPKSDLYVVMLGISLGAILLGCLFLALVWNRYDFKIKPTASLTPPASGALMASNLEISPISDTVRL